MNPPHCAEMPYHIDNVILRVNTERTRAKRQSVILTVDKLAEPLKILSVCYDTRQSENTPRRIVRVNRHPDPILLADRYDAMQKITHILPQLLLVHRLILREQRPEPVLRVALVPSGKRQLLRVRVHC